MASALAARSSAIMAAPEANGARVVVESSPQDDRTYRNVQLENKLNVLLISDPTTDKASAALDVRVGHLCDPDVAPGLAHFLEHMLFLGTEKYPDENEYNKYLNENGGSSNAYTDMESTNYYFDVNASFLPGALDRFSQFFIAPLFTDSATERELNAVNSEHEKNLQNDHWRAFQLSKALCRKDHPFSKFGSGNLKTLKEGPEAAGVDLRKELLAFHEKYYSANVMQLVILGKETLDNLEEYAKTYFSLIVNKNVDAPTFPGEPYREEQLAKRANVIPVKETRSVDLTFPMRETETLYRMKPGHYISHLIGHEGKGSILAYLREKNWANDLAAGEARSCTDWSSFSVGIDLTEDGLANVDDVVEVVFAYIAMLKEAGPQEWVHTETATVAALGFQFLSKRQPIDYTTTVASNMQLFPAEHILSGPYKIYDYGPDEITETLSFLRPSNMIMTVNARKFEGSTDCKEEWYGTDYSLQDLSPEIISRWNAATVESSCDGGLSFPERNDMIAEKFDLFSGASDFPEDEPRLLIESDTLRCFYKPDNVFDMPKVNIMALMHTPLATESPMASVLSALLIHILNEHATEFTYLASMAGLHCNFSNARKGIEIHVSGYNHKAKILLKRILDTVKLLPERLDESLLARQIDKIHKQYLSFAFAQPYQHAFLYGDILSESSKWTIEDKLSALERVSMEDVVSFSNRFLSCFKAEVLVHGNLTPDETKEVAELFNEKLKPMAPFEATLPAIRVVQQEKGTDYYYRFKGLNESDNNSCLYSVYQMGPMDLATNAMLAFIHHLIKEPAFNILRTNEQLGYIVHTGIKTSGDNIKGLLILILSDSRDPVGLDERVELFLDEFRALLVSMSKSAFDANVQGVVQNFKEKNKNLAEESQKYWSVITQNNYIFRKYQMIADCVEKITQEETLRFFDKYVAKSGPDRSKMAVQVFAKQHEDAMSAAVPDEATLISDHNEFKRGMPLFPLPSKVDMEKFKIDLQHK